MLRLLTVFSMLLGVLVTALPAPALAATDPTGGRFGGKLAAFEERYGEPLAVDSDLEQEDASISTYEIQGFGLVEVTAYKGNVVRLRLQPIAGDTWTEEALDTVINDFGPTDADYEDQRVDLGFDEAGVPVIAIPGTSKGITKHIGKPTYDRWGADGKSGEFHIKLLVAVPGFYSGLAFKIGKVALGDDDVVAVQEPPAAPTAEPGGLTPEELVYLAVTQPIISGMGESMGRVSDLFGDPRLLDIDWKLDVASELAIWKSSYQAVLALTPPPAFAQLHSYLLEALSYYDQAADQVAYALDYFDVGALEYALGLMELGGIAINNASDELNRISDERGL